MKSVAEANYQFRQRQVEVLLLCVVALAAAPLLVVRDGDRVGVGGVPHLVLPPTCPSRTLLGVDCPGCGLTRSFVHLAHGDLQNSLQCHRLGWLIMIFAAVQLPYRLALLRGGKRWLLNASVSHAIGLVVIALLLGNWVLGLFGV